MYMSILYIVFIANDINIISENEWNINKDIGLNQVTCFLIGIIIDIY